MKKWLIVLILILLISIACAVCVNAAEVVGGTCGISATWSIDDSGLLKIEGSGKMNDYGYYSVPWDDYSDMITSVEIADTITSIGSYAFYYCKNLTSITIPKSILSIGGYAFSGCSNLENVYITDIAAYLNIDYIGNYSCPMFYANNLYLNNKTIVDLVIPDSVTKIPDDAFNGCTNLANITLPDGITSIGDYAFYKCNSLTGIELPDGVTSIGIAAFYNCDKLINVTIPSTIEKISERAFNACDSLTKVNISDLASWCNISFHGGEANPLNTGAGLYVNGVLATEISIPNGVASIKDCTFYNYESLKSIKLPDGVTSIGNSAFYGCSKLTSIELPDSVTSIGSVAFNECSNLISVTIPHTVTSIGNGAFRYCIRLKTVKIKSVANWCKINFVDANANPLNRGASLYSNGVLVESVTIPQEITSIKAYTFYNCDSLKKIKFHNNLNAIYGSAFYNCSNLNEIYFEKGISTVVTSAFDECNNVKNVYYSGSEEDWNEVLIGGNNDCLTNSEIINFGVVIPKTYIFVANGGTLVADIEGEIAECPVTTYKGKKFVGWYDNELCTGTPIIFPYSGIKTTLYAKWEPVIFTETTLMGSTPEYQIYSIVPYNIPSGSSIMFVCYNGNKLSYMEIREYKGENPLYFINNNTIVYDTIKILVWENLTFLNQLCDAEIVGTNSNNDNSSNDNDSNAENEATNPDEDATEETTEDDVEDYEEITEDIVVDAVIKDDLIIAE